MPFIKSYESADFEETQEDENAYERFINSLPFEFEAPWGEEFIRLAGLPADLLEVCNAARAVGFTHFVTVYDGGNDEGFSYADSFLRDGNSIIVRDALPELKAQLELQNASPTAEPIQGPRPRKSIFARLFGRQTPLQAQMPQRKLTLVQKLDALADAVAVALLTEGFGTGEYEMYGRAILDLKSGKILDDSSAPKPSQLPGAPPPHRDDFAAED